MDSIIELKEANCKNCYKCIRNCPVKSIACRDDKARIMTDECIYCGDCLLICPQNAKTVQSDLGKVQKAIANGEKLYASIAPSYIAAFPQSGIFRVSAALKALGFVHAEETAIGAAQVTREYEKLIRSHTMKNIITTACPSVNLLVEKYYPELIDQLAPVVTPAVAHARMLKKIYGMRAKVVFIGPCISKKYECVDPENGNAIYAVLTFDDLENWMREQNIDFRSEDREGRTLIDPLPRIYPVPGGIIRNLRREERRQYECISIDGVDRCIEALDSIKKGDIPGYFLELNACTGGCIGGPVLKMMHRSFLHSKDSVMKNVRRPSEAAAALTEGIPAKFSRSFKSRSVKSAVPSEEEIRRVLAMTGKTAPEEELNCGCCGYNTCRDKAMAVLQGKADIHMCVPYMRELAESMSNTVVENIPAGVLILDAKLNIEHVNPSAAQMLHLTEDVRGHSISSLLPSDDFYNVLQSGENTLNHKQRYEKYDLTVEQTVVFVKESGLLFVLLHDITSEDTMREQSRRVGDETVAFARDVVGRQLRTVQDIVSLLGETTMETNAALSNLAKIVSDTDDKNEL
jgi:iron only hydrogenase large subunit-like protein/uncharacterized Fe-S cluster-containing protein